MGTDGRRSFVQRFGAFLALVPLALAGGAARARSTKRRQITSSDDDRLKAMEKQMEQMAAQLGMLQDVHAIRRVQYAYGYYMDKCLYDEVVDLFTEDGEVHFAGGVYRGRAGQRRLYAGRFRNVFAKGANGPVYAFLLDHLQLQDIIDVAPDRRTAQARLRCFMQAGAHETKTDLAPGIPRQWWEGGVYENTYAKGDDGVWRIKVLNYRVVFQGAYEEGWAHWKPVTAAADRKAFPEDPLGPDEFVTVPESQWPQTAVVPFHYAHPVTNRPWA